MSIEDSHLDTRNENYNTIKTDAKALLQLVNKYVKVRLIKETEFLGFVHSIDPVYYSIILLVPEDDSYSVNIIPGHAILSVVETHSESNKLPDYQAATQTTVDVEKRKQQLISWFKKNLLPITEQDQKILFGNVSILPPYGVSNICTDNPVVATQIRKMIENMPDDFEPDN